MTDPQPSTEQYDRRAEQQKREGEAKDYQAKADAQRRKHEINAGQK